MSFSDHSRNRAIGQEGEENATAVLQKQGFTILKRNFTTPFGELDIVAEEKGCLVFVEVKFRSDFSYGYAGLAVNRRKQERIIKSAITYLKMNNIKNRNIRFDVFAMKGKEQEHIRNAFQPSKRYFL